jgi:hypothetical protein
MENKPYLFNSLKLSDEELETISSLSALNYTREMIAMYLEIDLKQFNKAFHAELSAVKFHFDKGKLESRFLINDKLLENAKSGNITAAQEYNKFVSAQEVEAVKKRILFYED